MISDKNNGNKILEKYNQIIEETKDYMINQSLNETNKKIHVAIYVRVSTEEQKREGFSIRAQIEKLTKYASIKDWIIFDIYDDKGISGKNIDERPELKRMIEDIKKGKIDVVLVFKLDRLTRSIRDLMELTDIFNENKCEFCSLTENIDTHSASGRMFLKILGIFAEFERENLIERVRSGFERKAKEGYTNAKFITSYGYNRNKGEKILTVNEEEANIVQYIFKAFAENFQSEHKIAKELNARQIKTKMGHYWNHTIIQQLLKNPTYIGKIRYAMDDKERYDVFDGKHEPIITKELFEKAQDILNNRQKAVRTKRPKEDAYFTGLLVCSKCGSKMVGHRNYRKLENGEQKSYIQYICPNSKYNMCIQGSVNHNKLENSFIDYISNIEEFKEIDEIEIPSEENNIENKEITKEKLNESLYKLEIRKHKIMDLFLKDKIAFHEYKEMTNLIEEEKVQIENSIFELEENQEEEEIKINKNDIILSIKENWLMLDNLEKMNFLQSFVENIKVESEKEENSHFKKVKVKEISFNKK